MPAAALKLRHPQAAHLRKLECRVCKHVRSDEHGCASTITTAATLKARLRAIAALQCKRKASTRRAPNGFFGYTNARSREHLTDTCNAVYHSHPLLCVHQHTVSAHHDQSTSSAAAKGSYSSAPPAAAAVPAAALPLPVLAAVLASTAVAP
jgi:hypothetical protein